MIIALTISAVFQRQSRLASVTMDADKGGAECSTSMMDAIKIWVSEMQQFDVSSQQSIETFVPEEVERLCHSFGSGKSGT